MNDVRARFDHVFTTGGIGPTHDDITSECISKPRSACRGSCIRRRWSPNGSVSYKPGEFNAARQRMATMPRGATLIENAISSAPGFTIGNVHVMAGVPRIMQSMFTWLAPTLAGGPPIVSRAVHAMGLLEGRVADGLRAVQDRHPALDLGSYPFYRPTGNGVALVAKGPDAADAEAAITEVTALITEMGLTPVPGEPPAS